MKTRKILISLLLSAVMLLGLPGLAFASASASPVAAVKAPLAGSADWSGGQTAGEISADGAGNYHLRDYTVQGSITLQGEGLSISGQQTLVLNGYVDPTFSGPLSGTITIRGAGSEVFWQGRIYGFMLNGIFFARVVAQGSGPFAGTQLKLEVVEDSPTPENPNPDTFTLNGQLLNK